MSILVCILIFMGYFFSSKVSTSAVNRFASEKSVNSYRVKYILKTINLSLFVFYALVLSTVLGFEYSQVSIFLSSVFAVLGVALFAQWSILSNVTASLIIFFGFPYRVGDHIKIIDKDDDIIGVVEEITLFHVLIKREEELIIYPNTLILQKGVIKNPNASSIPANLISDQRADKQREN